MAVDDGNKSRGIAVKCALWTGRLIRGAPGGEDPAVTGRTRLGVAVGALVALAAAPSASAVPQVFAGAPGVGVVVVQAPESGRLAGRVVLDIPTSHPEPSPAADARVDLEAASHEGVVRVRLRAGGRALASAGSREPLLLDAPGRRVRTVHRIVLGAAASGAVKSAAVQGPVRLGVVAQSRLVAAGAARPAGVAAERRTLVLPASSSWRARLAPRPLPVCERAPTSATAGRVTLIALRCMGDRPRVALAAGPRRGSVSVEDGEPGLALVGYRAPHRPGGSDLLVVRATNGAGVTLASLRIGVRPYTMRAIGDSVTAGFGYLGDGTPMSVLQLPFCIPPSALNDRCSSNSSNGPSTGGPPSWSPDFGYGNAIAWPAQFARVNGIPASAFENLAVSGAAPVDWATGGQLADVLAEVVADDPDLTVITLGANPLLDLFLAGRGIGCAATLSDPAFRACVQKLVDQQQLVPRLRAVIAQLLVAPGNRVVVSQYHQAIPASSIFGVSSLRILGQVLNANVAEAVQGAPGFGTSVFLMEPPLFPVGLPPGSVSCPGAIFTSVVDGQSRQSEAAQDELLATNPLSFCDSTEYWIISADTGIHPSVTGHAQYAAALQAVVEQNDLGAPGP
jgi:lysophospholipase L1-like esterase